jgi:hypothetical protein
MKLPNAFAVATMLLLTTVARTSAAEPEAIVLDETTPGSVSDAILDGFPGLAGLDGSGDFGGNALGVALQTGVTEERAFVEFPLAELGDIPVAGIESATLTFNIDDVVGTFGPGTGFDGTAANAIRVVAYSGDGVIALNDFPRGAATPLAVVSTTGHGTITDPTLAVSGPLVFHVDVQGALTDSLEAGDPFLGIAFAVQDNKSATSLDNLGDGGAGPAGVGGSRKPYLTVVLAAPTTTTTTSSTTSTLPPDYLCGDVNNDGRVMVGDALVTLRTAVGSSSCPPAACDADGNGTITAADAFRILRFAVGLSVNMACDEPPSQAQPIAE